MALLSLHPLPQDQQPQETSFLAALPDGPQGVRATINFMSLLTRRFKTDPAIVSLARQIVALTPEKNPWAEASAIQTWVRDNIRYVQDVEGVETVSTPIRTLQDRAGDCDDKALLAGALLQAIGYKVRYKAINSSGEGFDHVYAEDHIGPRWVAVETTEPVELGWEPESVFAFMIANA